MVSDEKERAVLEERIQQYFNEHPTSLEYIGVTLIDEEEDAAVCMFDSGAPFPPVWFQTFKLSTMVPDYQKLLIAALRVKVQELEAEAEERENDREHERWQEMERIKDV